MKVVAPALVGIGSGSIWLNGQGRLGIWQIFNNLSEPRVPDSFLAVRAKVAAGPAVTRVLQTKGEGSLRPVEAIDFEGGYPIARLTFHDAALPIEVVLEALNPMIPLDTANSSIPCALFRLTAKNPGNAPVEAAFCATLQNAVGNPGAGGLQGVRFGGHGGNRNRLVRGDAMTVIAMDKAADPVATGPVKVRSTAGKEVPGPELLWLAGLPELTAHTAEPLARIAAEGGVVLADGAAPAFFQSLATFRHRHGDFNAVATVFDDFDGKTYEGWTIVGDAFGKGPSQGTEPGQQSVTGFAGHGLVNTFVGGDGPQGTATSKPFRIQRRYIGFLIGGGNNPGKTCINLRVGGKVLRTATGKNQEALDPASWDVADLKGKEAVLEIVDRSSGGWGHINIDRIIFSDIEPEPLLRRGTTIESVSNALALGFATAEEATLPAGSKIALGSEVPFAWKASIGHPGRFELDRRRGRDVPVRSHGRRHGKRTGSHRECVRPRAGAGPGTGNAGAVERGGNRCRRGSLATEKKSRQLNTENNPVAVAVRSY